MPVGPAFAGSLVQKRLAVIACLAVRLARPEPFQPPSLYDTIETDFSAGINQEVSNLVTQSGPNFTSWVYFEQPYVTEYDKRVIFSAHVQQWPYSCTKPDQCAGRNGGDEFEMIETGFVGFNDTWVKTDNLNCDKCGGEVCWTKISGHPGCKIGTGACVWGDDNKCNRHPNKQSCPATCTWSEAQRCISYCTQTVGLNARYQDNTKFAANAYLGGKTASKHWYYKCYDGVTVENDQGAYGITTPDSRPWGNRWIKLDLKLVNNQGWYTWTFFEPRRISDTNVRVVGIRSLMVEYHDSSRTTFDTDRRYAWVFRIWQYNLLTAVPQNTDIPEGMRRLHYSAGGSETEFAAEVLNGGGADTYEEASQATEHLFDEVAEKIVGDDKALDDEALANTMVMKKFEDPKLSFGMRHGVGGDSASAFVIGCVFTFCIASVAFRNLLGMWSGHQRVQQESHADAYRPVGTTQTVAVEEGLSPLF